MSAPDPWVTRHLHHIPAGTHVLDMAAGGGRHSRLALEHGYRVTAVDRNISDLKDMNATVIEADLEAGPWPFDGQKFDGILVCNYLWRPLFRPVIDALSHGGVLIWTTFAVGNEKLGRPRNPDFLLRPNELLKVALQDLEVIAFEHGEISEPRAVRQSITARRR